MIKFWCQVAACVALALAALGLPIYELFIGANSTLWGGVLLFVVCATCYLLWAYRAQIELPGSATLLRGPRSHLPRGGRIALTFDDGPNGKDTEAILDVLQRYGARATFFCVGKWAAEQPAILRRMVGDGHVIGNHTQDHRKLAWLSRAQVEYQIDQAQAAISGTGVPAPVLFRAPHGVKSPILFSVLRDRGMKLVAWSQDIQDFQRPGVQRLVRRAYPGLRDGEIMLMHDGDGRQKQADRTQTVEALEEILKECSRRELQCVTVPELFAPA